MTLKGDLMTLEADLMTLEADLITLSHFSLVASSRNTLTSSLIESVGMSATPEQSLTISSRAEANIDGDDDEDHPPATRATAAAKAWTRDARSTIGLWVMVYGYCYTGTLVHWRVVDVKCGGV